MDIETKIANHRKWNVNHVDLTREPLSPVKGRGIELSFRPAKTQYLMTPPASTSSESGDEESSAERVDGRGVARTPGGMFHFRPPSPPGAAPGTQVAFRRRIGRLNRLWIDRRGLSDRQPEPDQPYSDRWKYDQDDDDEQPEYELDPYGPESLAFRSNFQISPHLYPRRADSSGGHHGMNHAAAAAAAAQRQAALQAQATPQRSG